MKSGSAKDISMYKSSFDLSTPLREKLENSKMPCRCAVSQKQVFAGVILDLYTETYFKSLHPWKVGGTNWDRIVFVANGVARIFVNRDTAENSQVLTN